MARSTARCARRDETSARLIGAVARGLLFQERMTGPASNFASSTGFAADGRRPVRKGTRSRPRAEVGFVLIRVLVAGRLMWGGGLPLASLRPLLGVDSGQVSRAVEYLRKEGLALVDRRQGTISLTDRGLRELSA
jgi:hypothetical protein